MKKFIFILFVLFSAIAYAQEEKKLDQIFFVNGDVLNVEIKKIGNNNVEYVLPETTFLNTINQHRILKIRFRDGQEQHFNKLQYAPKLSKREIVKNKIAILPISFIWAEDGSVDSPEKARIAQRKVYNYLKGRLDKIEPRILQTPQETNVLLRKSGIQLSDLNQIPIQDLQSCLGVEYILFGNVEYVTQKYQETEFEIDERTSEGVISEKTAYHYTVFIDLYKNEKNIYSKTRRPLHQLKNSWLICFEYLLKRMPIYD